MCAEVLTNFSFPDVSLTGEGPATTAFAAKGIHTAYAAFEHVRDAAYGRNNNPSDPFLVLYESCGTCSTKHRLLALLARENHIENVQLIECLFRMSGKNTPAVAKVLQQNNLPYVPEMHQYLRINGTIVDVTGRNFSPVREEDRLSETVVSPDTGAAEKIARHRAALARWLPTEPAAQHFDLETIWKIREACIAALSAQR